MKRQNVVVDNATGAIVGTVGSALMVLGTSVQAAVPAAVTDAIDTGVTDIGIIGAAILVVVVAVAGFNWLRKPIH